MNRLMLILCLSVSFVGSITSAMAQSWTQIPNSGAVTGAAVLPGGTIIGIGMDNALWTRATLTSDWNSVPNSGAVISISVMADGTILGVGTDRQLWTRATLTSDWKQVPNSGAVISVAVMVGGTILGVGTDQQLWTRATLTSDWKQIPNSGAVTSIAVMADGAILGVGTDQQLWTRATLTSDWKQVPNSGHVRSVAAMPDGSILGVGVDNALQTRSKDSLLVANASSASSTSIPSQPAPCTQCPPWVSRSVNGSYLPLADQAGIWSNPKPFNWASGQMTVQSKFLKHFGTTCVYDVQFNNVGNTIASVGVTLGSANKAEAMGHRITDVKAMPGKGVIYQMEHRGCPLKWGESKEMELCASCEPILFSIKK